MAAGHSVRVAYDGPAAMELAESQQSFDIAVVDIMLPQRAGFAVIAALRKRSAKTRIVAIAGTSQSDRSLLEAANNAGANVILTKPIARPTLAKHIQELMTQTP